MTLIPVTTSPVPPDRGCGGDIALVARALPLFPVERTMRLAALAEARGCAPVRIGWAAAFIRGYALVARELPILRTWLARGLRPRFATAAESVATLAVNRPETGTDRLFFARIPRPESTPLTAIQDAIDGCTTRPVAEAFRRQLELERLPGPLRRAILRWNMGSASRKRPARIGTFSLSTLAGFQATNRFHPTLCTTSLSYGPLERDGRCLVTLIADHRVLDGATAARALERLEHVLTAEIATEVATGDARPGLPPAAAA